MVHCKDGGHRCARSQFAYREQKRASGLRKREMFRSSLIDGSAEIGMIRLALLIRPTMNRIQRSFDQCNSLRGQLLQRRRRDQSIEYLSINVVENLDQQGLIYGREYPTGSDGLQNIEQALEKIPDRCCL